jgi:Leucine-rich repeat (LRR) protein
MTRHTFSLSVCLLLAAVLPGCQPTPSPAPSAAPPGQQATSDTLEQVEPADEAEDLAAMPQDEAETADPTPPAAVYSAEQMAAARQLASDLAVLVREDAEGHVILIDTAANRSWVDDYQMQQLLVFPTLQTLTVEGPSITEQLAPKIAEARGLTSLAMRNTLINDEGIAQLGDLKALRIIDLRLSSLVTDAAMDTLAAMPELRAVRLSGVNVTDAGVGKLLDLPNLTELDLRNCRKVSKAGIAQIGQKRSLRMLKLGGPEIDDEVLELVADMDHLTGLSLDNCDITDAGLAKLERLPLDDLTIFQCANVSDEGLGVLAAYDRLRRLTLRDVAAQGTALEHLPNPELLVALNLEQSAFSDPQTPLLARFTGLQSLNLSQTHLTDDAVDALAALTWLKTLILTQTDITDEAAQRLRQALPDVSIRFH